MRQAQTLNEAQLRRVIKYTRSRRHQVRDETIILTSFYAGLRAKEIAALTVGNVFDEDGNVRTQFILSAVQSKGGQTRTVYLNQRCLNEVSTHHLEIPGGTYAGIFWMAMSPKTWDKLSDSQKEAVMSVSGENGSRFISQKWDEQEAVGLATAKESGNTITRLSDADTKDLFGKTRVFRDDWVAKATEAGLDGEALMQGYEAIVSELK